jgi:hypothetical protein
MKTRKLPKTDSIEALANFWDEHDLTDFEDQLEEVADTVFERGEPIEVRLQSSEADSVRRIARTKGVSEGALIREWVLQKLLGNGRRRRPTSRRRT